MMVILVYITGCLFVGQPLVNAQIEDPLSNETRARIHKRLDNIDRLLAEMDAMLDDMLGKNDPSKAMITVDFLEEQLSSSSQRLSNVTSSLADEVSSLGETVERFGQFTRATVVIVLLYIGVMIRKYQNGLIRQSSEQTMIKEENNGEKGLIQNKTIV